VFESNENREKSKPIIDLDTLQLEDEELDLDVMADPDARTVPPEGKYVVKLGFNASNGSSFTQGKDRRGRSFIMANLMATIIADGKPWNNCRIFDSRSTLVLDSSGTCGLMAIPRALKVKVPAKTTKTELVKLVRAQLEGEPLVGVEVQWQSRYQDENGAWKTFRKGMRNYPQKLDDNGNPTGHHIPEAEAPDGQSYAAKAVVVGYMPAEEVR
jgi:hypothetical protein